MSLQALQNKPTPLEEKIVEFKGLNRKAYVEDGELSDMKNMSSDCYPVLTQRKARGNYTLPTGCTKVYDMIQRRDPVDGETKMGIVGCTEEGMCTFWYGDTQYGFEGLTKDEKLVAINNKICMFPSKNFLNLVDKSLGNIEFGNINSVEDDIDGLSKSKMAVDELPNDSSVSEWTDYTYPECIGRILIDPNDTENLYLIVGAMKVGADSTANYDALYTELATTIKVDDVLHIAGTFYGGTETVKEELDANEFLYAETSTYSGDEAKDESYKFGIYNSTSGTSTPTGNTLVTTPYILGTVVEVGKNLPFTVPSFNVSWNWYNKGSYDNIGDPLGVSVSNGTEGEAFYGIYIKFAQTEFTTLSSNVTPLPAYSKAKILHTGYFIKGLKISRVCPNLSYVIEWNNRLWGASDEDNTIYASKLGDPTAWDYFNNTSMDSYYAEQGTNGSWTGCARYSSHLLFFKENYIHRVYGSAPSSFQTSIIEGFGVEEGSEESIATVNNMIFYKSPVGIMCYEGDNPYSISEKFGDWRFNNVVAGARNKKYYASIHMKDTDTYKIIVCDTGNGIWHIEDTLGVKIFRNFKNELLMVDNTGKNVLVVDAEDFGISPVANDVSIPWEAVFGPFDEYIENTKIYSRLQMRVELPKGSTFKVQIAMDKMSPSECEWETITDITAEEKLTVIQPIVPRRCSRFFVKLSGVGKCRIDSLTRKFRQGSTRVIT